MVGEDETAIADSREDATKRYNIILRIRHPGLDPAEITAALGWEPDLSWRAGDKSVTPNGRVLASVRSDGVWSRTIRVREKGHIAEQLDQILDHLLAQKKLFRRLDQMRARSALYLQLPGDTNNGDTIGWQVLRKFAELRLAFEVETFPEWR